MICPKCGFDNSDNSKFCINCAANLVKIDQRVCPNCKAENPSVAKFCYNCATSLSAESPFLQKTSSYSNINSNREEELRRELERLRLREQIYPEKKKSNKAKWLVIGLSVFLLFSVVVGGLFLLSYQNSQSRNYSGISTQNSVQEASINALGKGPQIVSMTDDGKNYYITIKNTNSNYITINSSSFKRDGSSAISSNPSNANIYPGESKTFAFAPNGVLTTGKTHTFTITGIISTGEQTISTVTYADS